jgi:hypothetical protein
MYKKINHFMQRETRHDLLLERATTRDENQPLKKRSLSKSEKSRRAAVKKAKKEREITEAGIKPSFITAIGPLVTSLNLKGVALATELNRRGIKTPNGGEWSANLAKYVRLQTLKP